MFSCRMYPVASDFKSEADSESEENMAAPVRTRATGVNGDARVGGCVRRESARARGHGGGGRREVDAHGALRGVLRPLCVPPSGSCAQLGALSDMRKDRY